MKADYQTSRSDDEPEADGIAYEFACDQVAAELEAESETAQLVATLSNAELVMSHLMSAALPAHLIPYARDLADLVRNVSGRVEEQMKVVAYDDVRDAA
ncbi:hypothetical protein [Stenotrophomonas sp. AB1(2024)]|uniref:hypothetical protein n=1 Tax=Stenotrophomonas sp. AB1(2024) TaxID=3132215 RepID=UPI0030A03635